MVSLLMHSVTARANTQQTITGMLVSCFPKFLRFYLANEKYALCLQAWQFALPLLASDLAHCD